MSGHYREMVGNWSMSDRYFVHCYGNENALSYIGNVAGIESLGHIEPAQLYHLHELNAMFRSIQTNGVVFWTRSRSFLT